MKRVRFRDIRLVALGFLMAILLGALGVAGALLYARAQRDTSRPLDAASLRTRLEQEQARLQQLRERLLSTLMRRARREVEGPAPARLDILALSGGAQYGAFAAGVLEGWAEVQDHPLQRPTFDLVTGISAGAMLASSALMGRRVSDQEIQELFTRARTAFSFDQLWNYRPWKAGILSSRPLMRTLAEHLSVEVIEGVAQARRQNRLALIMAVNVDLGRPVVWSLSELAQRVRQSERYDLYWRRVMASAALPPLFPPVLLDNHLHVDGGASHLLFTGPGEPILPDLHRRLRDAGLAESVAIRVWVVLSSPLWPAAGVIPERWPTLGFRSARILSYAVAREDLRRIHNSIQEIREGGEGRAEFRYLAVPAELEIPDRVLLSPKTVRQLERQGRQMGKDPSQWKEQVEPR